MMNAVTWCIWFHFDRFLQCSDVQMGQLWHWPVCKSHNTQHNNFASYCCYDHTFRIVDTASSHCVYFTPCVFWSCSCFHVKLAVRDKGSYISYFLLLLLFILFCIFIYWLFFSYPLYCCNIVIFSHCETNRNIFSYLFSALYDAFTFILTSLCEVQAQRKSIEWVQYIAHSCVLGAHGTESDEWVFWGWNLISWGEESGRKYAFKC